MVNLFTNGTSIFRKASNAVIPLYAAVVILSCSKKEVVVEEETGDVLSSGWTSLPLAAPQHYVYDHVFLSESQGYLITFPTSILMKTTDGGSTWKDVYVGSSLGVRDGFNQMTVNHGDVLLTSQNLLWAFRDDRFSDTIRFQEQICDVQMISRDTGYLMTCRSLFRSLDGGRSWNRHVQMAPLCIDGQGRVFHFKSSRSGWIGIGDTLYSTVSDDRTFQKTRIEAGIGRWYSINAPAPSVIYFTTDKGWFKSTDGGASVSRLNVPSSVKFNKYSHASFLSPNVGYISSGNEIYKTEDGGVTWINVARLSPTDAVFELFFLNENNGWAGCKNGRLLRYRK